MTKQESLNKAAQEFGYADYEMANSSAVYADMDKIIHRAMDIYAGEQYNEGINDCYKANEKANILLAGLREKSKYNEAYNQAIRDAAESAETEKTGNSGSWFDASVNKQSILKLLK